MTNCVNGEEGHVGISFDGNALMRKNNQEYQRRQAGSLVIAMVYSSIRKRKRMTSQVFEYNKVLIVYDIDNNI